MRVISLLLVLQLLLACSEVQQPECPSPLAKAVAPSAGCFAVQDGKLLVVESLGGEISPPGGSSVAGESAQCTAHRETWEETGLDLQVDELLLVMDTGFHLYRCSFHANSGEIDPPRRLEISRAFMLHHQDFDRYQWRYPEQVRQLKELLRAQLETRPAK
jgi:8-oxo-dGTP diphosphatase